VGQMSVHTRQQMPGTKANPSSNTTFIIVCSHTMTSFSTLVRAFVRALLITLETH
jgi:hypothetical protein